MTKHLMQLGYVGLEVSDFDRWRTFATDVLGLGVSTDEKSGAMFLRMDAHDRRFILTKGAADDIAFAGWQVADAAALDAFTNHLVGLGREYTEGNKDEAALRGVEKFIHFTDPLGVRHEAFCGPRMGKERFVSPTVAGSFITGEGGLGHVVFGANAYQDAVTFAADVLGASMSDIIRQQMRPDFSMEVSFLHVNERHHSIAFAALGGPKKLHHFMIEVDRVDEVGRARDRALKGGFPVAQDIGQHPNDRMISIYVQTPSGFLVEFGWGGVKVDDADWRVVTYQGFSEWGHRPALPIG